MAIRAPDGANKSVNGSEKARMTRKIVKISGLLFLYLILRTDIRKVQCDMTCKLAEILYLTNNI